MRTETKTVTYYTIKELSPEAQRRAHEKYLGDGFEYTWWDEGLSSVVEYVNHYYGEVQDYSLSTHRPSYINAVFDPEWVADMDNLDPPESMTGYCLDSTFTETLTAHPSFALAKLCDVGSEERGVHMLDALDAAVEACVKDIVADMEYQESLEYFIDHAEINGYEFLENGTWVG